MAVIVATVAPKPGERGSTPFSQFNLPAIKHERKKVERTTMAAMKVYCLCLVKIRLITAHAIMTRPKKCSKGLKENVWQPAT
jgi:hypothetical protein